MKYIKRLFDESLDFALKSKGAVLVVGPKWCGKSTTCKRYAKTVIDLMSLETRNDYINLAKISPSRFLNYGKKPIMIDEWQHVAFVWDQIKFEVDRADEYGQYILTGSVTDKEINDSADENRHTGNGRIIRKMMRTLSLYETGESNGTVSIKDLKNGRFTPSFADKTINDYAFYICRGGWPKAITEKNKKISLQQAIDYYEVVVTDDIFSLKDVKIKRDVQKARKLMRSYARNVSIASSNEVLRDDVVSTEEAFDKDVFAKYITALKNLYVIDELAAWNPNLRSRTAIRTKETRHFVDPSIGAAALGITPEGIYNDMTTFGFLFESLVVHDLRVYCDSLNAHLYKYRDSKKREADAVIQFQDGSFALVEVKLGNEEDINEAARKLLEIAKDIDEERTGKLAFMMVVTKNKVAYQMDNGVYVVPLCCLKN